MGPRHLFAVSLLSAGIIHAGVLGLTRLGGHTSVPPRLIAITLDAAAPAERVARPRQPERARAPEPARAVAAVEEAPLPEAVSAPPSEAAAPPLPAEAPAVTPPLPIDLPEVTREEAASAGGETGGPDSTVAPVLTAVTAAEHPSDVKGITGGGTPRGSAGGTGDGAPGGAPRGNGPGSGFGGDGATGTAPGRLRDALSPRYPLEAKLSGREGTVRVLVRLDSTGVVLSAEVLTSSGHQALDRAALEAVRNAAFAPAVRDGHAVPSGLVIPIRFRLTGGGTSE